MKEIQLANGRGTVLVDDEDYPLLSRCKCHMCHKGYARNKLFYMHSLIMGFPRCRDDWRVVDHKDRNKLNNQKHNLRLADQSQSNANKGPRKDKRSCAFRGVHAAAHHKKTPWLAVVKGKHIGYFATAEEAARAYDTAARKQFGDFAYQNFAVDISLGG